MSNLIIKNKCIDDKNEKKKIRSSIDIPNNNTISSELESFCSNKYKNNTHSLSVINNKYNFYRNIAYESSSKFNTSQQKFYIKSTSKSKSTSTSQTKTKAMTIKQKESNNILTLYSFQDQIKKGTSKSKQPKLNSLSALSVSDRIMKTSNSNRNMKASSLISSRISNERELLNNQYLFKTINSYNSGNNHEIDIISKVILKRNNEKKNSNNEGSQTGNEVNSNTQNEKEKEKGKYIVKVKENKIHISNINSTYTYKKSVSRPISYVKTNIIKK
jgi:hypothetical protein